VARRRIAIGSYGELHYEARAGVVRARTRVRDRDGVLRKVSASGASREAARRRLLEDIRERFETGTGGAVKGITPHTKISVLADEWIKECEMRELKTRSLRIYRDSVRLHIKPYMGGWLVHEATTGAVDRVLKEHRDSGRDTSALRKHLNQMFALAVRHDALSSNPVTNVAKIQRKKQKVRVLEDTAQVAEIRAIIANWENGDRPGPKATRDLRDMVLLLMSTGARIGEALALRWQDINLLAERPYLRITGTIVQEKGVGTFRQEEGKSEKATRPLEVPPTVVTMLLERQMMQGHSPIDAVFPSRVGTWTPYSTMYRRWNDATDGTKYEWVTFKTFRKQVGTLIAREFGAKVAKEQLGHANEVTTETFYIAQSVDAPKVSSLIEKFIQDSSPKV
jgi:integrase